MAIFRIRKDKKGRNRYQRIVEIYRNGHRFYKSKTCNSKKEALDWERKLIYEIDNGITTKESLKKRKLSDAIQKYIDLVLPQKPKNAKNVIHHLNWWSRQIGNIPLSEVTPATMAECRERLSKEPCVKGTKRTNTTVIRYLASISIVFEYCIKEWHWITQNPVRSIKKPPLGKGKTRFFTQEEIHKIRTLCSESDSEYLLPIFIIALHTGMRKGEILSLRWDDIDFKNKEILLPTSKNGEPRDIPMTKDVYKLLSDRIPPHQIISGLIFPSPHDQEKPIHIRSAWERVLRIAEINNATFHTIRHSTCSYLARLGIPPILIARIVGHKDSRTTDRYTHAIKTHMHEAIEKLGDLIAQA